jgi:hypothetical protein
MLRATQAARICRTQAADLQVWRAEDSTQTCTLRYEDAEAAPEAKRLLSGRRCRRETRRRPVASRIQYEISLRSIDGFATDFPCLRTTRSSGVGLACEVSAVPSLSSMASANGWLVTAARGRRVSSESQSRMPSPAAPSAVRLSLSPVFCLSSCLFCAQSHHGRSSPPVGRVEPVTATDAVLPPPG